MREAGCEARGQNIALGPHTYTQPTPTRPWGREQHRHRMGCITTVGQLAMLLGRAWMSHACGALAHLVTDSTVCYDPPFARRKKTRIVAFSLSTLGENRLSVAGHAQRGGYQGNLFRTLFCRRFEGVVCSEGWRVDSPKAKRRSPELGVVL